LQCLCYSCMAGVSFAVPAFQTSESFAIDWRLGHRPLAATDLLYYATWVVAAFHAIGLSEKESAWTNLAFIGTGVVVGLIAGKYCTNPKSYPAVIKTMFVAASAGMVAACMTTLVQEQLSASVLYALLVIQVLIIISRMRHYLPPPVAVVVLMVAQNSHLKISGTFVVA
jgi:hypothetical protein